MKKLLVVFLAVTALPMTLSVSTVCTAGNTCGFNAVTGKCIIEHLPCGSYSKGTTCQSVPNPTYVATSAKRNSGGTGGNTPYLCQCGNW